MRKISVSLKEQNEVAHGSFLHNFNFDVILLNKEYDYSNKDDDNGQKEEITLWLSRMW
jgi:hypothetical protein